MIIPHPGLPLFDPGKSIFINCPYDDMYEPYFDALVFTILSCKFIPRCAKETNKPAIPRMERIFHALYTSNYSIHDLSRCKGEGEDLLARFNMPLELGLAMSRRYPGDGRILHEWLVLVPEGVQCNRFVSDLAGHDLQYYQEDIEAFIRAVLVWLRDLPGAIRWNSPTPIIKGYRQFCSRKGELKEEWKEQQIPWEILLETASEVIANV